MKIIGISTRGELLRLFPVYQELRPHLHEFNSFCEQIFAQFNEQFRIYAAIENDSIYGCIGFREMTTTAWGKIVYIDDLITAEEFRGNGAADMLLDFAIEYAKLNDCKEIHLDTGYQRFAAHKVYLNKGFQLNCHHLALKIN